MKELEDENETMRNKKNENEKSHRSIQEQLANQVCAFISLYTYFAMLCQIIPSAFLENLN